MTEIEQSIRKDLQEKLDSIRRDLSKVHLDVSVTHKSPTIRSISAR
jgi:hypothetical protein